MEFWTKSLDFLRAQWIDTWNTLAGAMGSIAEGISSWWYEGPGKAMREDMLKDVDELKVKYRLEEDTVAPLRRAVDYPFPVDVVVMAAISFPLHLVGMLAFWTSYRQRVQLEVNELERLQLLDPSVLVAFAYRHPELKKEVDHLLAQHGISDRQIDMLYQSVQVELPLMELMVLVNRGEFSEDEAIEMLTRQGMSKFDAQKALGLRFWNPSPQDVISLAGREAYEPDQIAAYDLLRDYPRKATEWGGKVGVSEEIMKHYWAAHWSNPSINQVFEMIQRKAPKKGGGVWTTRDLETYFRLADINPYFTEALQHIAYNPLTRVDVRRMFQMGVLTREELTQAYEDAGYSPVNAVRLMNFTVKSITQKERDLSKAQIETLYTDGFIDALEYRQRIQKMGYDEGESFDLQDILDFKNRKAERDSQIKATQRKFFRDLVDVNTARSEVVGVGIHSLKIDSILRQWEDEKPSSYTLPTKADVLEWFQSGKIESEEFNRLMKELGYRQKDIETYRNSIAFTPALGTVREWFAGEQINEAEAMGYLKGLGIGDREIRLYLEDGNRQRVQRAEFKASEASRG